MKDITAHELPHGAPDLRTLSRADLIDALRLGWRDFRSAPGFGLFFAGVYVVAGLAIVWLLGATGNTVAALPLILGFPLLGPFVAVGFYEISRRLQAGEALDWKSVLGVVWREKDRQMPSIAAIVMIFFLFWNFLAHMIFALFMGLQVMTNISSSFEVFLTPNGLMMLAVGTAIGAVFSFLLFALMAIALPMLLDREVDFMTAMLTSFSTVTENLSVMLVWGIIVAVLLLVGMLPGFLGLFVVLPLLGHATWHVYDKARS
ncbi:MAG: putative membrane protein [Sulfitobacter sp.]|jgi:uncharacterized membrane protein